MTTAISIPSGLQAGAPTPPDGGPPPRALTRVLAAVPPPGLVLLAIVSIQVGAALAVHLFASLGPEGTVFLRVAISALLLFAAWRPALDRQVRDHLGLLLLYGAVMAATNLCFYQALARIPLGIAVTIEFMGPLALAVVTSRRLPDFLWIALAVLGIAMLAPRIGDGLDPVGVGYAVASGIGWGSFILLSKRVGQIFERGNGLALGMAVGALVLMPFGLPASTVVLTEPLLLLAVVGVAILSTTIPFSLEFEALKRMPPRSYGVLVTLEPAVAVMVGAMLLGDALNIRALFAVACVTTAAIGITMFETRDSGKSDKKDD